MFTDYLIIDPAALWDNNYLNKYFQTTDKAAAQTKVTIYFAFANNAHLGNIGITNRKWGEEFASALHSEMSGNYIVTLQYFEDESHGTVALPGWYHGLKLLLSARTPHAE